MPSENKERPRQRIEQECQIRGKPAFVLGCIQLLRGGHADDELVFALGGPHASELFAADALDTHAHWLRVWAARGLLWEWDDVATGAICAALHDDAWRVREMACKVIRRNEVGDALPLIVDLVSDPVPRVRSAARGAVERLTAAGA